MDLQNIAVAVKIVLKERVTKKYKGIFSEFQEGGRSLSKGKDRYAQRYRYKKSNKLLLC